MVAADFAFAGKGRPPFSNGISRNAFSELKKAPRPGQKKFRLWAHRRFGDFDPDKKTKNRKTGDLKPKKSD